MKNKKPLTTVLSVRVDKKQVQEARRLKIDMSKVFREALTHEMVRVEGKCKTCGHKSLWEKIK